MDSTKTIDGVTINTYEGILVRFAEFNLESPLPLRALDSKIQECMRQLNGNFLKSGTGSLKLDQGTSISSFKICVSHQEDIEVYTKRVLAAVNEYYDD